VIPDTENSLAADGVCRWCIEEQELTPRELVAWRDDSALSPEAMAALDEALRERAKKAGRWRPGKPGYDAWKARGYGKLPLLQSGSV
jgi:hypothetical protein